MPCADYLALLNSAANDTGEPELPVEDEVVRELLLCNRSPPLRILTEKQ